MRHRRETAVGVGQETASAMFAEALRWESPLLQLVQCISPEVEYPPTVLGLNPRKEQE